MEGYWKAYVELNNKTLDEAREIFIELATQSECVVWYYHSSGKKGKGPHFHALIKNGRKTDETYRNALKAKFGVSGGQFGVSNKYAKGTPMTGLSIDKYVTYMTKGQYEPFYNKGFDDSYLTEKKLEWVEPAKQVQPVLGDVVVNIIEQGKAKRITQVSIARMVYEQYNLNPLNCPQYGMVVDKLVDMTADKLYEYGMSRNYRQVANIVQDVWCSVNRSEWKRKIISMI